MPLINMKVDGREACHCVFISGVVEGQARLEVAPLLANHATMRREVGI